MKVIITGHTRGLGKILFERYGAAGHNVFGYSLSSGFDLNREDKQHFVSRELRDADVFINNAPGIFQHTMLIRALDRMSGRRGTVVCSVSSLTSRYGVGHALEYSAQKAAVDIVSATHQQRSTERWPASLLYRAGYIDTDRSIGKSAPKVSVHDVADMIMWSVQAAHEDRFRVNEILVVK